MNTGTATPAVYVSWDDAQAFITALNTHITNTGQGDATFHLPSEAQWEYACRANTTTRFYWGDDPYYWESFDYAWIIYNTEDDGEPYAHYVGLKIANNWGLDDMSGNVKEWCEDWYHDKYRNAPANGSAWVSPARTYRVLRGGSWDYYAGYCRSAKRHSGPPDYSASTIGFRVAMDR